MRGVRAGPRSGAEKKKNARERRDQICRQAFAVAPEPIEVRQGLTGRVVFPRLQSNAHDPASPLPDGEAELPRKVFAGGDRASVPEMNGNEFLAQAEPLDAEAALVILRHARGLEY